MLKGFTTGYISILFGYSSVSFGQSQHFQLIKKWKKDPKQTTNPVLF
jgi:hypothetical protein